MPLLFGLLPLVASCSGGDDRKAALNADPPTATATASIDTQLRYDADPGGRNDVTLSRAPTAGTDSTYAYYIDDANATITPGKQCESMAPTRVRCESDSLLDFDKTPNFVAYLGDEDDRFTNNAPDMTTQVSGEEGNDVLNGGVRWDDFHGGDGTDSLHGGGGCDTLNGDAGSDFLDGGSGPDHLWGEGGVDTADYGRRSDPLTISIDTPATYDVRECQRPGTVPPGNDGAAGEGDVVYDDVENIWGGTGNDFLTGSVEANVIDGGPGNDTIDGGLGADSLVGGDGTDRAYYVSRASPGFSGVTVRLDGVANDGAQNEGDNVHADVENVLGTPFDDILVGAGGVTNGLSGLAGNDTLAGGESRCGQLCSAGRPDYLDGGPGYDTIDYGGRGSVTASADGVANDGRRGEGDNDLAFENVIRDNIPLGP